MKENEKKAIEEMARKMCRNFEQNGNCSADGDPCYLECIYGYCAERIYAAGYRKQKEGVWIKDEESKFEHRYHCSVCNFYLIGEPKKHCEDCGAKMKGGAE